MPWLVQQMETALASITARRQDTNVILYGSAFLQKPQAPAPSLQITHEDLNGFMSVIYGMAWHKPLTLIIHTPGGVTNAAETIVAYLRAKFPSIEVIIPAYAMSAGTMISLAAERVIMGRQSQLGPIDPQMPFGGRFISARAVVDQFEKAKSEILSDLTTAHVWAPILQSLGPSLVQEAQNALKYGEQMVAQWLSDYMFAGDPHRVAKGAAIAEHFGDASKHLSHGRRIDIAEADSVGVQTELLENDQDLQEDTLTVYHLMTIFFEQSSGTKMLWSHTNRQWIKHWTGNPGGN